MTSFQDQLTSFRNILPIHPDAAGNDARRLCLQVAEENLRLREYLRYIAFHDSATHSSYAGAWITTFVNLARQAFATNQPKENEHDV